MSAFSITTATNNIQIGKERRAAILFTVTNQTGQALTGRAAVAAVPAEGAPATGAHAAWVAPLSESERPFPINGVQNYTVKVNVPAGAPAGDYTYRLDMVATHNPDETYTAGPTVVLTVLEEPKARRFPLWIIPLIAGILVLLLVVILILVWPRGTRVPNVVERPVSEAQATVTAAGLLFQKAGEVAGDEVPPGIVVGTTPEAGERLRESTPVLYVESAGPEPTITTPPTIPAERLVPDVVGLTVDNALATLEANEFTHRPGGDEFSADVAEGLVARTDPGAGTLLVPGSRVVWFQSLGPEPTETPPPPPTPLGGGRLIVFSGDGNEEIYVMKSDGSSAPARLTNDPSRDVSPAWSPFGDQIAFSSDRFGNNDIFVMNADGSNQTRLTNDPSRDGQPSWSPDGTRIAFGSTRDGNCEIYVMDADGSNQTRLTDSPDCEDGPQWSPDGTRIAYISNRQGNYDIYVMNPDGSNQTRLTTDPAIDTDPSWSPDGTKIAFSSHRTGNYDIYVMNADGSDQTRLTADPAVELSPSWSPDGTKIAYSSSVDGNYDIYLIDADGLNQARLTDDPALDAEPSWSPDG